MTEEGVEVVGLERLQATLSALARTLPDIAPPGAATVIGAGARARVPKRSGALASSFSPDAGDGVLSLRFGAPYAAPIHWGVGARPGLRGPHNIRPSRYLTSSIEDLQSAWVGVYETAVQDAVDQVRGA